MIIATRNYIFVQGVIDMMEGRDVAFADILDAFLHTKIDKKMIVLLTGQLCELMVALNPQIY